LNSFGILEKIDSDTKKYTMNHLTNYSQFINESASIIHMKDMLDQLAKADSDLGLIKDDNARQIKGVLNKMIGDLSQMEVMREVPTKEFMQNLVASLQRAIDKAKHILDSTV